MKKLLSVVFLLSLVVSFISVAPSISAIQILEGAVIKTDNNPDVYIVKYKNGKQFKRLVLNPQVFESYGHLRWEDILIVSQSVMDSFVNSDLVRVDGQADVCQLIANGDIGSKHYLVSNDFDLDSIYTINEVDFGNYITGEIKEKYTVENEQDSSLKIEKCKSEYNLNKNKRRSDFEKGQLFYFTEEIKKIEKSSYEKCIDELIKTTEKSLGISFSMISGMTYSSYIFFFSQQCDKTSITETAIEEFKNENYLEIDQQLQIEYQECLNK